MAGQEIVTPPVEHHVQVINLMDALKQSVEKLRPGAAKETVARPLKKMGPSTRGRAGCSSPQEEKLVMAARKQKTARRPPRFIPPMLAKPGTSFDSDEHLFIRQSK